MREIKFRGLTESGRWAYGYLVRCSFADGVGFSIRERLERVNDGHINVIPTRIIDGTEGQFTGLTDKNGVEIFEGDVLFWDGSILGAVRFDHAEYVVGEGVNARALSASKLDQREVIGNIHANPELLEVEDD